MSTAASEPKGLFGGGALPLPVVDGTRLPDPLRSALRPGEDLVDSSGVRRRLPCYFYEVASWDVARDLAVAPSFCLWEFLTVDVREAPPLLSFPRYIPCAVTLLAAHLSVLRAAAGTYVHIAANGGYRSPGHRLTRAASRHCWASAANIYRVGDDWLDDEESITRYAELVRAALPGAWLRPFGSGAGQADDHLHIDLGYVILEPVEMPAGAERMEPATRF